MTNPGDKPRQSKLERYVNVSYSPEVVRIDWDTVTLKNLSGNEITFVALLDGEGKGFDLERLLSYLSGDQLKNFGEFNVDMVTDVLGNLRISDLELKAKLEELKSKKTGGNQVDVYFAEEPFIEDELKLGKRNDDFSLVFYQKFALKKLAEYHWNRIHKNKK
jgi:hypothetical protein